MTETGLTKAGWAVVEVACRHDEALMNAVFAMVFHEQQLRKTARRFGVKKDRLNNTKKRCSKIMAKMIDSGRFEPYDLFEYTSYEGA